MIAAPAVDLKEGRCVQLVGGRPDDVRVSLPDPVAQAERWYQMGFGTLHVVDLDAALGTGNNVDTIGAIVRATPADTQVGGGVRDDARAGEILDAGADRIIVGTRALEDPEWLERLTRTHPGRIVIALDSKGGRILRKGWTEETALELTAYLPGLASLPLVSVLWTDVGREGRLEGIDRDAASRVIESSPHPVWVSGGVTTIEEMEYLDGAGAAGVVLGMALYKEAVDPEEVASRWGGETRTAGDTNTAEGS